MQHEGSEDLKGFPVEEELGGPAYLVSAEQGNQLFSVLFVHSSETFLVTGKVRGISHAKY